MTSSFLIARQLCSLMIVFYRFGGRGRPVGTGRGRRALIAAAGVWA
ncbi:hypothetical protein [Streptomyces sp. TLI_053]|nr:hypothetical protein [Streptomyces sp. TLI_053]